MRKSPKGPSLPLRSSRRDALAEKTRKVFGEVRAICPNKCRPGPSANFSLMTTRSNSPRSNRSLHRSKVVPVWIVNSCEKVREIDSRSLAFRSAMKTRMTADYASKCADLLDVKLTWIADIVFVSQKDNKQCFLFRTSKFDMFCSTLPGAGAT